MQTTDSDFLFVYGTLQPSLAPPSVSEFVRQFVFVAPGRTPGLLYDLGDYPGAIFDGDSTFEVHGVVYTLPNDDSIWRVLDDYEGTPSLYGRVRRPVKLDDGKELDCWAYAYRRPVDASQLIPGGRYRR